MATRFFRDVNGNYVGGFDGAEPPPGSIEVPIAPEHAKFLWNGIEWTAPAAVEDEIIDQQRSDQVVQDGVTLEDRINALWQIQLNGDTAKFDAIQAIIAKAEQDFPK